MSTSATFSPATQLDARVPGLVFHAVRPGLWRVANASGSVRGHIERASASESYIARQSLGGARSRELGSFWNAQAAAESFA
ncbi:hypothetical protein WDJ51_07250 [Rathayibacter sp. YIM 133350]|uniref:hypothetical protein n=1 Tax=Rathayibacter sp. YIM 133350 TaxID=3131992 RepID=UPI00307F4855